VKDATDVKHAILHAINVIVVNHAILHAMDNVNHANIALPVNHAMLHVTHAIHVKCATQLHTYKMEKYL
jgi:hypothetical protein